MEFFEEVIEQSPMVHIRIQQRNGRKSITTIQGLEKDLDLKKILKSLKRNFRCNGAVNNNKQYGEVIQLQGDQRDSCKDFLVDHQIIQENRVQIHGF